MPLVIRQRPASLEEQQLIKNLRLQVPGKPGQIRAFLENTVVTWAVTMLAIILLWAGLCWCLRKLFGLALDLRSPVSLWLLALATPTCALFAAWHSWRWSRQQAKQRQAYANDLDSALLQEEHYTLSAAKRFQEPEHGGLLYCLLTDEKRVLVLYDYASQNLNQQEKNPLDSDFLPKTALRMLRLPQTGVVIAREFSGEPLPLSATFELDLDPEDWPEEDAYCQLDFAKLEFTLGNKPISEPAC